MNTPSSLTIQLTSQHNDNSNIPREISPIANTESDVFCDVVGSDSVPTFKQSDNQTFHLDDNQHDNQLGNHSIKCSTKQSSKQAPQQSVQQKIELSVKQSERYAWLPFNENQGRLLLFLYEHGNGLTNMEIVCNETGIAYGTARSALDVLIKEGYVTQKIRYNGHAFKGFEYSLNNNLCSLYASRVRKTQTTEQSPWQSDKQSNKQQNTQIFGHTDKQTLASLSSRSFFKEKTTTKSCLLKEPELRFWTGEGVTEKQVANWMAEFQLSEDEMMMSLRYGRFDILERGDVQNSANWFYKILARNGYYPKPANYRSMLEIRAEALLQEQERDREAKKQIEEIEFNKRFYNFLNNPDSPLYQDLLAQIGSFAKDQLKEGDSLAAEIELKELFKSATVKG